MQVTAAFQHAKAECTRAPTRKPISRTAKLARQTNRKLLRLLQRVWRYSQLSSLLGCWHVVFVSDVLRDVFWMTNTCGDDYRMAEILRVASAFQHVDS